MHLLQENDVKTARVNNVIARAETLVDELDRTVAELVTMLRQYSEQGNEKEE